MAQKLKFQPENNGRKQNSIVLPEDKQYKVTAEDLNLLADAIEKKIDIKLVEDTNWKWVATKDIPSLRDILEYGEMSFITFADGTSMLGRATKITNVLTESIKIAGFYYNATGGISLANIELIPDGTTSFIKSVDESKLGDFKTYTTANDFLTKAKDGEFGKYEKDGHMVIVYNNAGNEDQWITFAAITGYIGTQLTSATAVLDYQVGAIQTPQSLKDIITKLPAGLDNLNQLLELVLGFNNKLENKIKDLLSGGDGSTFRMAEVAAFPDPSDATEMLNLWKSVGGEDPVKNDFMEVSLEDWTKHALYHYDGTTWIKGTERDWHIKQGVVDMTGYDKTDALKAIFTQIGTIAEVDKLLSGETVVDSDKKTLILDDIKILVENIKKGTQEEFAKFSDDLFYKTPEIIEYRDNATSIASLNAEVGTAGNVVRYSTLIKPLDRISAEGSSFELTMNQNNMEVEYMFITHSKGLKFAGNIGDDYKWETILKNNVKYIKFTGAATLKITDTPLSSSAVWTDHAMPYEIPMNDLIDDVNNTAIVQMTFGALPSLASKIAHINYVAPLKYYEDRNGNFLKEILAREAYNYPTKLKETITYELVGNKPTLQYRFAGTNVKLFNAEVEADTTSGTTLSFKDVSPVKERIDKVNTAFTLIPAKDCSFKYEHPTNASKSIEISMGALSNVKFENVSNTQFKVFTNQSLKVDGNVVGNEIILNFADYMDANGMMKISNHYAFGVKVEYGDTIADLTFSTYDEFTTRELVNSIHELEKELTSKYVRKSYSQAPTFTHQAGYIVGSEGDLPTYDIGDQIVINLDGISVINSAPGAIGNSDVLFFGTQTSVKQNEAGVEVGLKWKTKTNPTEYNIEDNYLTKDLKVEKREGYYLLVEWVDKPKKSANIDLSNVLTADLQAALQRAGVDTNLLKHELVGAMGKDTTPTTRDDGSALQTGDWYIDSTGHTHMYAGGKFIVQSTATIDLSLYMKTADADAKYETKEHAQNTYETIQEGARKYQPKLGVTQKAHLEDELFTTAEKEKLSHLPINVMTEFGKYQPTLTDPQKLNIAKLYFTELLRQKYDGYEQTINGKANINLDNVAITGQARKLLYTDALGRITYVDYPNVNGKADKTLANVTDQDFLAKLQAVGINAGIFGEFKGVLSTAPTGTLKDLDWYINDTDNILYLWHNNKWNSVGGGATASLDKQAILNLLGLTSISQNQLALPTSDNNTMIFKEVGEYVGKINATTSGSYIGLFKGGSAEYAAIRLENGIPKLFGRDSHGTYNIDFASIAALTGKTLTDVTFTADDGTVTNGKLLV